MTIPPGRPGVDESCGWGGGGDEQSDRAEIYGEMQRPRMAGGPSSVATSQMDAYEYVFTLDVVMAAYLLDLATMQPTSLTRLVTEASDPADRGTARATAACASARRWHRIPELAEAADEPIASG